MRISDLQMLLARQGWYNGAIDGDDGPKTWAAIEKSEQIGDTEYIADPATWTRDRRRIAAGQFALLRDGFEPGVIDGYYGHNTKEALTDFLSDRFGVPSEVLRTPRGVEADVAQQGYPRQRQMAEFYGPAGNPKCTAGKVDLPIPFVIAWNKSQSIRKFSCHELIERPLTELYRAAFAHYGEAEFQRLELHIFGGCYNYRRRRGGRSLSTHAYGAAVDHNPEKNRLRWGADRAQFAQQEYMPWWKIVMAHGATPAGYAWGKDWMHFQFARL